MSANYGERKKKAEQARYRVEQVEKEVNERGRQAQGSGRNRQNKQSRQNKGNRQQNQEGNGDRQKKVNFQKILNPFEKILWQKRRKLQNWKRQGKQLVYKQSQEKQNPIEEEQGLQIMNQFYQDMKKYEAIKKKQTYAGKNENQLKKMVIENFKYKEPQPRKLTVQQQFEIDYQKPQKYQIGQFTNFARNQQKQLKQKQKYIAFVLREAVISYQKRYKQNYDAVKKLMQNQSTQQIQQYFNNPDDLKKFIQNQVQFTINESLQAQSFEIYKTASIYIFRKLIARNNAVIDGKFLKLNELKIQQRFYHEGLLYIPTYQKDIYIKLGGMIPKKVILMQNRFFEQNQINFLNQQAKKEIVSTVIDFLESKGEVMNKTQVQQYLKGEVKKKYPDLIIK